MYLAQLELSLGKSIAGKSSHSAVLGFTLKVDLSSHPGFSSPVFTSSCFEAELVSLSLLRRLKYVLEPAHPW